MIMGFVSLATPLFTMTSNTSFSIEVLWFQVNTTGWSGSKINIMGGYGTLLLFGTILTLILLIFSIIGFNYKGKLISIIGFISGLMVLLVPLLIYILYPGMAIDEFMTLILPSWGGGFTGTVISGTMNIAFWTYNWTFSLAHVINYVGAAIIFFISFLYFKDIRITLKKS